MRQNFERQEAAGGGPPAISLLALIRTLKRGEAAPPLLPNLQCALLTSTKSELRPPDPFVTAALEMRWRSSSVH